MLYISPNITEKTNISTDEIITVNEIGNWLRLNSGAITADIDIIENLIKTAIELIEEYSWLTLRRTTYLASFYLSESSFYSFFEGSCLLGLERSPILSLDDITKIEYLDENDLWVEFSRGTKTVNGLYENTTEKKEPRKWTSIYFKEDVPFKERINAYKIRITFNAGWDASETEEHLKIPKTLKLAIKQIVAYFYVNRGDCGDSKCSMNGIPVPCTAKGIIDLFSVAKTVIGGAYNPTYSLGGC